MMGFVAHFLGSCLPFLDSLFACANTPYRIVNSKHFLAGTLAFASGILLFTSFSLLFRNASEEFEAAYGQKYDKLYTGGFYFLGVLTFALLDWIGKKFEGDQEGPTDEVVNVTNIPQDPQSTTTLFIEDQGRLEKIEKVDQPTSFTQTDRKKLMKLSIKTLAAMALHNIPEGIVTFTTARVDMTFGMVIAFAIIFHNIPEGLTSVAPLYYATGSKTWAFFLALLAGLAEPLGALLAWAFLPDGISKFANAVICAYTAGVLSYIPVQGLLPTARFMDTEDNVTSLSFFSGIFLTILGMGLVDFLSS
jgi:ZIP family zinc transporter